MTEKPSAKIMPFALRPREFEAQVRRLSSDTKKIKWSDHARERMEERDIPIRVALTVLREGAVMGEVEPGKFLGEWKGKMVLQVKGRREVGVVTIVVRDSFIRVKTVEWEDLR